MRANERLNDPTLQTNMHDANTNERLDANHEQNRGHRIEAIKGWVDDIEAEPPETWGPQQNAVVDDQLDAAQSVRTSAAHQQHGRRSWR